MSEKLVEERIQRAIDDIVGQQEPEVIERLEALVARMRVHDLQNVDAVLERFAESEDRRRSLRQWGINLSRACFTVGITGSLWVANKMPPIHWWHWAVWVAASISICLSIYAFRTEVGEHLGASELRSAERARLH